MNRISFRKITVIVRPDRSYSDLLGFRNDGYTQAVFVANLIADPQCQQFNGNVYEIADLLRLDNPLYRTSHPNCNCAFQPYGQQPQAEEPTTVNPNEEPKENQGSPQDHQARIV
jgi:hypothetical protein